MRAFPYLTGGVGVDAVYKVRWEDFGVEEILAVEPEGHGDHTWIEMEKAGLTTSKAAADIAAALGVRVSTVGYAGMKDLRAVARQWLSVEHVAPDRVLALAIPRIRVLRAVRHPRKLRRGWHAGNRFALKLRPPGAGWPTDVRALVSAVDAALSTLARRGVPNYYGPQRFGYRGDTWRVGRALARGDWSAAASLIAGQPLRPGDPRVDPANGVHADQDDILRARERFEEGRYGDAAALWPSGFAQCVRLAAAMERSGGDAEHSLQAIGKPMLRFYASAYQAWLFNHVLARRAHAPDRLMDGDLAWKHDTDALFDIAEVTTTAQARADAFEISPTGPLVGSGRRVRRPTGRVARLETEVLRDIGFNPTELHSRALAPLTGRRRPLRFPLAEVGTAHGQDAIGQFLELRFLLPPGCYATAVLREVGKGKIVEGR